MIESGDEPYREHCLSKLSYRQHCDTMIGCDSMIESGDEPYREHCLSKLSYRQHCDTMIGCDRSSRQNTKEHSMMATGSDIEADEDKALVTDANIFTTLKDRVIRPVKKRLGQNYEPPAWDDDNEYDFTHPSRGAALLFNMACVNGEPREGSHVDVERLKETFTFLGFDICYKENQTKQQVMKLLKKESKRDHSKEDCFACVILTHGGSFYYRDRNTETEHKREDKIMATDEELLTSDLLSLFHDSECKSLKGKPKLFFIQACRGDEFDSGVNVHVTAKDEVDARPENSMEFTPCPIYKDFLVMYATPPGFYAFRHQANGSWFVAGLCKILSSPGVRNRTLHQLLTAVIKVVSLEYESQSEQFFGEKQTPCFISMLVKDVYFRPKTKSLPL